MSEERQAVFYGKVELIPGVICDGYVLDNGTAVMSERGTADLLGMHHKSLQSVAANWPPETLNLFIDKDFSVAVNSVEVTAGNSPHQGRKIVVYSAETIQTLISAYVLAFAHDALKESQKHIGKRCAILQSSLVRTALDAAIREACGLPLHIQQTVQHYVVDIVEIARELGLKSSVGGDLITIMDIAKFLGVKPSKVNYYLRKLREYLNPVKLNYWQIRATGSRATHMKAYPIHEALRVALAMDSVMGIKFKERLFGPIGILAKPDTRIEIHWEARLSEVANGLGFYHNYQIGPYRVDFFISSLGVALECNGYEHHYYDDEKEQEREKFITNQEYGLVRFGHTVSVEKLANAILRIKPSEIIRLFESRQ